MTTRKLFVSHSSKTADHIALLKAVCAGIDLPGTGYRSLWDQSGAITPGSDWDRRLNEWLAECHAAVILFSKAALYDSHWVQKEAAVLSWRRELEEDFTLIPVLLDGLEPEELAKGLFGILRIDKGQCITDSTGPAEIVDQALAGLKARHRPFPNTPFERLENVLADILEREARNDTLEDAWNALGGQDKPPWQAGKGISFSAALARFLIRDGNHALAHLEQLLNRIRPRVSRESATELLKYLASLWVDPEAAGGIPSVRSGDRVAAMNGGYTKDYTAKRYAERAWPLDDAWRLITIDTTRYGFEAVCQQIRDAFRPKGASSRIPDAALDQSVNQSKEPIIVLLPQTGDPPQLPDNRLLEQLRGTFPGVIWLLHTGPQVPDHLSGLYPTIRVRVLEPLLELQTEIQQLLLLEKTHTFINAQLHGSL